MKKIVLMTVFTVSLFLISCGKKQSQKVEDVDSVKVEKVDSTVSATDTMVTDSILSDTIVD